MELPFFVSCPHAGESVPPEASWLHGKDPLLLLRDVDRFVDKLYQPSCESLQIPMISTSWSRYVVDLNRAETDVDAGSVVGASSPEGTHARGLHWQVTTWGEELMAGPISGHLHRLILEKYYLPFHEQVSQKFAELKGLGASKVYHLDLHSMPSRGTQLHSDPGRQRAEVVVSDYLGKSADPEFLKEVMESYQEAGFEVALNEPYIGGGITQRYGRPEKGQHTLQIELNRSLYMNEDTKEPLDSFEQVQQMLKKALARVLQRLQQRL